MMGGKTLFCVSTREDIRVLLPEIRASLDQPHRFIALEWEAERALREIGAPHALVDDYLSDPEFARITSDGYHLAKGWYRHPALGELLCHQGIPLGEVVEHMIYYYFIAILRMIAISEAILAREKPDRVVLVRKPRLPVNDTRNGMLIQKNEHKHEEVMAAVSAARGIRTVFVEAVPARPARRQPACSLLRRVVGEARKIVQGLLSRVLSNPLTVAVNLAGLQRRRKSGAPSRVLLISPHLSVPRMFQPIVEEVMKARRHKVLVLSESRRVSREWGAYRFAAASLVPRSIQADLKRTAAKMWARMSGARDFTDSFVYRGVRFWDLIDDRMGHLVLERFPLYMRAIEAIDSLIRRGLVDLIMIPNEVREYYRASVLVGNRRGIPSLVVLHGVPIRKTRHFVGIEPQLATCMASWGKATTDLLVELGVDPGKLAVTGAPQFDRVIGGAPDPARLAAIRRKHSLDPRRPTVLLALDFLNKGIQAYGVFATYRERERWLVELASTARALPACQFIFKAHPGDERVEDIEALLREYALGNASLLQFADIRELILISDCVVTQWSTAGLEALVMGKPLIILNLSGGEDRIDYVKYGAALGVYTEGMLSAVITDVLTNGHVRKSLAENRPKCLFDYTYLDDGKAAARVADVVGDLLNREPGASRSGDGRRLAARFQGGWT